MTPRCRRVAGQVLSALDVARDSKRYEQLLAPPPGSRKSSESSSAVENEVLVDQTAARSVRDAADGVADTGAPRWYGEAC